MAAQLYQTTSGRLFHAGAIAIITVGLPARGKTHVSRSLCRYLLWLGVQTRVFSVGNYRRQLLGTMPNDFFDPNNQETTAQRFEIAQKCLDDMISWLEAGGQKSDDPSWLKNYNPIKYRQVSPVFIESICNKQEIIDANIRSVKISSPDYIGWDPEEAVEDFKHRIENHQPHYETITDLSLSFVKLMNVGEQIIVNNVNGYLQSRIVYYLLNLHITPRIIYFARNGESLNESSYKADAELSEAGHAYAEKLKDFLLDHRERQGMENEQSIRPLTVWTSARKRSYQTAMHFVHDGVYVRQNPALVERNPGECDGLTPAKIKARFPDEEAKAQKDPYRHRYPRAESYHDLAVRVEPVILELEREKNDVLIIAHESTIRCLYAYLMDRPAEDIPKIVIPRNYLIEIVPSAYGCKETRMEILNISA
ncbi:hypothetical protein BZG36_02737 [Bifiguratus adelaidae]|uniref:6-phosphofructo-2-kinase domain-containing protein n=1 Tax=Bifiguratus adelaidae TaxID=1938954 RepID=A0A261XYL2_9FUNG|nr:hypothetical protein BZG36_02737 [Bifiguratus adelaidae]